ncbi:MAG: sensor histidine kinase [Clostridium sp.]
MSFINLISVVIKKEKSAIFLYLLSCISIMIFYYLIYDEAYIGYPTLLCLFSLTIYLVVKVWNYNKFYNFLKEIKTSPSYRIDEENAFEDVFNEIREIHNYYISKIYNLENKYEDREKLIVEWIHNMKTSVSIINLAIDKLPESEARKDIKSENDLLKNNLEGALNIFRLDKFYKDYVIEEINLRKLVKECINSGKRNFIYSNIFPEVNIPENYTVLSDRKWCKYVIEQIISNAIKYSDYGQKVCFYANERADNIILTIKDSGIGIKKEDLTRIFDAFYTGSNGRENKKSSGIGLFMCKTICDSLNNKINVESEELKGTTVSITFLKKP